jgi:hypothetical protein
MSQSIDASIMAAIHGRSRQESSLKSESLKLLPTQSGIVSALDTGSGKGGLPIVPLDCRMTLLAITCNKKVVQAIEMGFSCQPEIDFRDRQSRSGEV